MKLNKYVRVFFVCVLISATCSATSYSQIDSSAVAILDKMSAIVGNLQSCSLRLKTQYDILDDRLGLVTHSDVADVFLKAPDKLYVTKSGDKGNKEFFYDGTNFTYYSKDNNLYSSVPAPPTIIQTIDSIHSAFGIDFPASDFFYPYFVDDLLDNSNNLADLGVTTIDAKQCYHIAGTTDAITYQMWIADDGTFLPVKMNIVYIDEASNPQYTADYYDWNLNVSLQNSMFDFIPPPNALKVKLVLRK